MEFDPISGGWHAFGDDITVIDIILNEVFVVELWIDSQKENFICYAD